MLGVKSDISTMFVFCVLAVSVTKFDFAAGAAVDRPDTNKDLVLAFVVHRHGERTPAEEEAALSPDLEVIKEIIELDGYEALTNEGKRRAYQIGKFLRQRYGSSQGYHLISKEYRYDELSLRTTAKDRTQMTAQIAMAALYSPEPVQQWDGGLGRIWQPIPYTTVPLSEDYLRYYSNCAWFKSLMKEAKERSLQEELAPYTDLIPLLKEKTGANFTEDPLFFETLFDLFRAQIGLGLDLPEWAKPLLPRLTEAARLAYKLYFRNDDMKKIGGGVMLNHFMQAADSIASGEKVNKRLRIFSSHDFNIGSLMEVTRVEGTNRSIPEYGALFALELYRCKVTGQYYVLPVYLLSAGSSSAEFMKFSGCESSYCDLETFRNQTSRFLLPENEFYQKCSIRTEL